MGVDYTLIVSVPAGFDRDVEAVDGAFAALATAIERHAPGYTLTDIPVPYLRVATVTVKWMDYDLQDTACEIAWPAGTVLQIVREESTVRAYVYGVGTDAAVWGTTVAPSLNIVSRVAGA